MPFVCGTPLAVAGCTPADVRAARTSAAEIYGTPPASATADIQKAGSGRRPTRSKTSA
jgi:hypothetical protein